MKLEKEMHDKATASSATAPKEEDPPEPEEIEVEEEVEEVEKPLEEPEEKEVKTKGKGGEESDDPYFLFTKSGFVWKFFGKTKEYQAYKTDEKGSNPFRSTPRKGKGDWEAVINLHTKKGIWVDTCQEAEEEWLKDQGQGCTQYQQQQQYEGGEQKGKGYKGKENKGKESKGKEYKGKDKKGKGEGDWWWQQPSGWQDRSGGWQDRSGWQEHWEEDPWGGQWIGWEEW